MGQEFSCLASELNRLRSILPILGITLLTSLFLGSAIAGPTPKISRAQLAPIARIVEREIRSQNIPGAVVLIGHQGTIVYRQAFGYRSKPNQVPMTVDTLFDLASLTKVIATTTALLQLAEGNKLRLDDSVASYWPEFNRDGKEPITLHHLLTHYSGLKPTLDPRLFPQGKKEILEQILKEKPTFPPGTEYLYSDINFLILGEIVERVSGQPLDLYCYEHIFKPLGMKDTCFNPSPALRPRIAPTYGRNLGEVNDPTAFQMGGVAGHAGLFSTADDLSLFAEMLLAGGAGKGGRILSPSSVEKMSLPQSPSGKIPLRGFGWDLGPPLASNRPALFQAGSFGHTGFTGTLLWIDPISSTYVIVLSSRTHPSGRGNADSLRAQILTLVSDLLGPTSPEKVVSVRPLLTEYYPENKAPSGLVKSGIDVLVRQRFLPLLGLRVGLITNHSGLDSKGERTIDLLRRAPGLRLRAIFCPEHGLSGHQEGKVRSSFDPSTGLPVYSLYGEVRKPTENMLKGLDGLVFDIQEAGARFYTYITTMAYAMEAAAERGIRFYVLDRPNPITGSIVQGPVMDPEFRSFTGFHPLPIRHGMTVGELAAMFNVEGRIGANLQVIRMEGYERHYWYDETGLPWVALSPNLQTLSQAILYPGVALVEAANVSVGRGTATPFEVVGAPWIDGTELARHLSYRKILGVSFQPVDFIPRSPPYKHQQCHGIRILLEDRQLLDSPYLGIEIAAALYRRYPEVFKLERILALVGTRQVLQAIKQDQDPRSVRESWTISLLSFQRLRSKYLLY